MHIEIQVALNFVISYLYNKLPRRRVNIFGEELDRALKAKFDGHWYPEKPFKGSAYRCLRAGTPLDPVIENAARESGVDLTDIRDNLPDELSIWIDPGEVSYRIGEKGSVKIIYADDCLSGGSSGSEEGGSSLLDKERSFNPEAQCFKPIESVTSSLANLAVSMANAGNVPAVTLNLNNNNNNVSNGGNVSPTFNTSSSNCSSSSNSPNYANSPSPNSFKHLNNVIHNNNNNSNNLNNNSNNNNNINAATTTNGNSSGGSNNQQQQPQPTNGGGPTTTTTTNFVGGKHVTPLTFTTATFAQTKFGSTKLKSSSKRSNRMSPTEFSNYIKQRAMMQQQQQQSGGGGPMFVNGASSPQPQRPRSLSPINLLSPADQQHFVFMANHHHQHGQQQQQQQQQFNGLFDNSYLRDLIVVSNSNNAQQQQQHAGAHLGVGGPKFSLNGDNTQTNSENSTSAAAASSAAASPFLMTGINDNSKSLLDGINFNLNNMPYSSQHLLVAN